MERRFLIRAVRSGLITVLLAYGATAHCEEGDAFAKWAAAHAVPLSTVDFTLSDSELLPLQSAIGSARIVALGETIHGAHEPLAFRNRLFRFLVERMGFTAIALESGFSESISARSFIEGGKGDAETAVLDGLGPGLAEYRESLELVQWMHDYNAAAAAAKRRQIRLYGADITTGGRTNGPRIAINAGLAFLSRADPTTAKKIRDSLSDSLPGTGNPAAFGPLSAAAQAEFETRIEQIAKAIQQNRKKLIANTSADEYRWASHSIDDARQLAKCLPLTPSGQVKASVWIPAVTCRDYGMAQNVKWILENEGRQGRLLVFAHNGHVVNGKEDSRRLAGIPESERPPDMGFHLHRLYGDALYIIVTSTARTSGDLLASKPLEPNSLDSALASAGLPLMFLDTRMARQNKALLTWLSIPRSFNSHLAMYSRITPSTAADAYVFISTLTPASPPPKKAPSNATSEQ
jgi:erythromycin esterase